MNPAMAVSSPLQHGTGKAAAVPGSEERAPLGRSLLLIPLLAAAAWIVTIGPVWLAWQLLK